jgi:small membrane protein
MNFAAVSLLALVLGLLAYDWLTLRGKNRRALWLEATAFAAGAFFIAFPDRATALAHAAGIGRGVDFLIYPIVIWLVRESLLSRRRRVEDGDRLTQVVRALAIDRVERIEVQRSSGASPQSVGVSASRTP